MRAFKASKCPQFPIELSGNSAEEVRMFSLLFLLTYVGLIFSPRSRRVAFRTLSGVFGLIACVLAVAWATGTGAGRRLW
jgi:hypothetical protein